MYSQNGDHSAVTGGTGTERLMVFAPEVTVNQTFDSTNSMLFDAGIDFITSASTDNIDYNMSSASYHDANFQFSAGYSHYFGKPRLETGLIGHFSMESDYTSLGFSINFNHQAKDQNSSWFASFTAFFDDLRWGRLNPDYRRPVTLVYPIELRDTLWFNIYMRYSFNLSLGFERVINKYMLVGIYPGIIWQQGLLSTPYHRVYFIDDEAERVENLPRQRFRFPIGAKLNSFVGNSFIVNTYYRFYADDFGILASTFEAETFWKINAFVTPSILFRFYNQTASSYFRPYMKNSLEDVYYTSDYDLSKFHSFEAGAGVRLSLLKNLGNWSFDEVDLRYNYYWRSDGLRAHYLSTCFGIGKR
jgi:hypothetical protein